MVRPAGRVLVYAWAIEQEQDSRRSAKSSHFHSQAAGFITSARGSDGMGHDLIHDLRNG